MADTLPPRPPAGAAPITEPAAPDWPAQVTAFIVDTVEQIRSKTTRPVIFAVRAVVFGLIAAVLGITILALLFIGLFRAVDVAWSQVIDDAVWLTYLSLGVLFCAVGAILFRLRKSRS
jgi:hypothetical protein